MADKKKVKEWEDSFGITGDEDFSEEDESSEEFEQLEESVEKENHPAPKPKKVKAKKSTVQSAKDDFGLREGTARSKAAALYSRPEGATLLEVKDELGAIHFNVLTKLKRTEENPDGFEVTTEKEAGNNNRTVTRYFLHKRSVD